MIREILALGLSNNKERIGVMTALCFGLVCRGIPNFLIFDPKHTLWVLVRTASARRF